VTAIHSFEKILSDCHLWGTE